MRDLSSIHTNSSRFRRLLDQFIELQRMTDTSESNRAVADQNRFQALLAGYNKTAESYRQHQEQLADDFNLLEVMRLTGKEIRHSMVLAWLLDHDMRKLGTHAQGKLGFRLFLNECKFPTSYADCNYWVRREVAGDESIVDVEIACRERFLIHIENKIWSSEGADQTDREWSDLQRRATDLKVSKSNIHAFYLTPHGTKPANLNFQAIPWSSIVRVLEVFADQAKPPDVKLFTSHYARALKRFIAIQDTYEKDNDDRTVE